MAPNRRLSNRGEAAFSSILDDSVRQPPRNNLGVIHVIVRDRSAYDGEIHHVTRGYGVRFTRRACASSRPVIHDANSFAKGRNVAARKR